ncbi:actinodin3 [Clupea harengus]|uniref:Actinodin3 n=1 Tax=Clupea harengus TaxID=7950 RepID=A0A8M1KKC9_CLUHA|nr:actinodin3 [Clupea harengus]
MTPRSYCTGVLLSLVLLPVLLEATSLSKVIYKRALIRGVLPNPAVDRLSIDPVKANDFLSSSRPRRAVDPKWFRKTPDFQSYYRYYNSIGHYEGLYEIDKIRILYQQMRHLELEHGPDASRYQNLLGAQPTPPPPTPAPTTPPPPTTQPPPPPPTPAPYSQAAVMYLCNPKDPQCKANIVYMPLGAVPILCDPRHHPACKPTIVEGPMGPVAPAPQILDTPQAPPALIFKGMEYDCDPYWDPDCLIDHPPRAIVEEPQAAPAALATKAPPAPPAPKDSDE